MGHALVLVIVEPETPPEQIERRIDELMEPYDQDSEAFGREWIEDPCSCTRDGEQAADPKCDECDGSGIVRYSYNPQEVFDWYEPGGRWDGQIREEAATQMEWNPLVPEPIRDNMVLVRDIPTTFVPWAVLTPDGTWHGGSGYAEKDMEAWAVEQAAILSKYADHLAISVDFHY
jgi:hypothetical protein